METICYCRVATVEQTMDKPSLPKINCPAFLETKKQSAHYRILRSYKDTLHGADVHNGLNKTGTNAHIPSVHL